MFGSFYLAGFECATGYNRQGEWIDQIRATQHDAEVDEDYKRLVDCGFAGIREGIRWPLVDVRGRLDFSSVAAFAAAARRHRLTVIWDLFHYGYPADLDPFTPAFTERFAAYCRATALWVAAHSDGPYFFTPVNEPSFFAWAGGDQAQFAPYARGRGPELKLALVRAAIRGIDAIRAVLPSARIVNADPWCRVVPPFDRPDRAGDCRSFNQGAVFESWDMLCGRLHPELGGSRRHLDIIGINYYWTNQWELDRNEVPLADDDPRRCRLLEGIREVYARYGGDLMISETSHVGDKRAAWLSEVAADCEMAIREGIPLRGCCLYPILGMPEWHLRDTWSQMGLWECRQCTVQQGRLQRVLHAPMSLALQDALRVPLLQLKPVVAESE